MQEKSVHIVFQVLNFIYSDISKPYKLFPIDKLILIGLAKHKGKKGIFPMQQTLANELKVTRRYIIDRIKYIQSLGLLSVKKIGIKNHYSFNFLSSIGEPQFTYQDQIGEPQFTYQDQIGEPQFTCTETDTCTTVHMIGEPQFLNRGTTVHSKNIDNNKVNKSERETAGSCSLSESFLPNQEAIDLCTSKGWDVNFMKEKFIKVAQSRGNKYSNYQAAFVVFIMNEKSNNQNTVINIASHKPIKPIIEDPIEKCSKCNKDPVWCNCRYVSKEEGIKKVAEIMEQFKLRK